MKSKKDGQILDVLQADEKEKPAAIAAIKRDLAECKQSEADLKKKVEYLRHLATVVSDSNDAVIMHDFEGKILAWNRGAKDIYGYTEAEALGKNVRDIVAGEDREAALALIQKIKHGEVVKSFELRRVTKDGRILNVWLTTTLLTDEKGKPEAIATTERDITELKRSEIILKHSYEKLKEVDKLKSNFISIASHELRTPLTIIKGFIAFLIKESAGQLNDAQKNFANTIDLNITRLERIINDMVDMSKIEAGILSIEKETGDFAGTVREIVDSMKYIAEAQGVILGKEIEIEKFTMNFDSVRVIQAITNLINNAVKFSPKGAAVTVSLKKYGNEKIPGYISEKMAGKKAYAFLSVLDHGVGVEKENIEKIFDRFYRVGDSNERKQQGMGLGLSIAKSIIESHNGFIWAESEGMDSGTKVNILLPEQVHATDEKFPISSQNAGSGTE